MANEPRNISRQERKRLNVSRKYVTHAQKLIRGYNEALELWTSTIKEPIMDQLLSLNLRERFGADFVLPTERVNRWDNELKDNVEVDILTSEANDMLWKCRVTDKAFDELVENSNLPEEPQKPDLKVWL
jgi:hypothetical protein|tara:strand:+ start:779 stop:1165 length:387 start_codon:yes stop_codon:yes gene_type:complete